MGYNRQYHQLPQVTNKAYGKYRGVVAEGTDTDKQGKIKVMVPALFGHRVLENWAYPVIPVQSDLPHTLNTDNWNIPIGAGVWIEFEGGDLSKPLWCGFWRVGT